MGLLANLLIASVLAQADVPPVPGLCSAPVPKNRETPGCYKTGEIQLIDAPDAIYWHIYEFPSRDAAISEGARHRWAAVTEIHSRTWLYILGGPTESFAGGIPRAVIGPLKVQPGIQIAHFAAAIFPPGMRTRVHSHPGPEAFYVVEGQQCMETPTDRQMIPAGGTYIVERGPHIQAAPGGRRNLVLILAPEGAASVIPGGNWRPTSFCD